MPRPDGPFDGLLQRGEAFGSAPQERLHVGQCLERSSFDDVDDNETDQSRQKVFVSDVNADGASHAVSEQYDRRKFLLGAIVVAVFVVFVVVVVSVKFLDNLGDVTRENLLGEIGIIVGD